LLAIFVPFFFDLVKCFSKKQIVFTFGVLTVIAYFFYKYFITITNENRYAFLLFSLSAFLFSCILSIFRIEILYSWLRFLSGLIPISFLLTWLHRNDSGMFTFNILLFSSFILPFMTLFLIVIKTWELRRIEQGKLFAWWVKWLAFVLAFILSIPLAAFLQDIIR